MGTRGATPGDTPRTTEVDELKPLPDPTAKGKPPSQRKSLDKMNIIRFCTNYYNYTFLIAI